MLRHNSLYDASRFAVARRTALDKWWGIQFYQSPLDRGPLILVVARAQRPHGLHTYRSLNGAIQVRPSHRASGSSRRLPRFGCTAVARDSSCADATGQETHSKVTVPVLGIAHAILALASPLSRLSSLQPRSAGLRP